MNAQAQIEPSIVASLAKALAEIEGVQKNKQNPHLKNKYADLSAVIEAIQPITEHGLWYRQVSKRDPEGALIETFYIHDSGAELSAGETFVPANKKDPQGFGSALTYCRRYALQTAFGLAPDDDDGEAATKSYRAERQAQPAVTTPPAQAARSDSRPQRTATPEGMPDHAWAKLVQLVEATKADTGKMLKHFNVADLRQLAPKQYDEAVAKLEADLAAMAKADTNRAAQTGAAFDLNDEIAFT